MSGLVGFFAGAATASIIGGVLVGMWLVDRDIDIFERGRCQGRDDLARWHRGTDEQVPDWEARNHPARRSDRGASSVDHALALGIVAGLVLVAPTLRWWTIVAALLIAVLTAGMSLTGEES